MIMSAGLRLHSPQYVTKVEYQYKEALEAESRAFLAAEYPSFNYTGIQQLYETNQGLQLTPADIRPVLPGTQDRAL